MRTGVIDIGSRSTKLLIGEDANNDIKVLESLKNIIPIANDTFQKNRVSQETINLTIKVLEKYKRVLADYGITDTKVFATTAVREARNKNIFVDTILRKTGLNVEVLMPGDIIYYIDAYLSFKLKDDHPIHTKNILIAELGSGSLDISLMQKGFSLMHVGLPLGTLRLKQLMTKLNGSLEEIVEGMTEYITNELSYLKRNIPNDVIIDDIILIDENYSNYLSNILKLEGEDKFYQLGSESTLKILEMLAGKSPAEISQEFKIPIDTADTLIAYVIILDIFFNMIKTARIFILESSLAEAVLAEKLLEIEISKKYNKTNQLISSAKYICSKYNADLKHGENVANMAETLFTNLREQLGLKKDTQLYLMLAAYLHDIGMFIHNRGHDKHSEYIISNINLFRLTETEMKMIAAIARYHRKFYPSDSHPLFASLPLDKQIIVQKLSSLLRMANALDRSHTQKVKKLEIKLNQNQDVTVVVHVSGNFILEQENFQDKKELFEEITGNKVSLVVKATG